MPASTQYPRRVFGGLSILSAVTLIAMPVEAGKAPPPSTPDPCAPTSASYAQNWAGFPAFAYVINTRQTRETPSTYEIRLASKNGVCSKRVGSIQAGLASGTSFARNGAEYVIAWGVAGQALLTRFDSTLATPAAANIPAVFNVFRTSAGALDLSPDGAFLAYTYQGGDLYPNRQIRVADLGVMDVTGSSDATLQTFASENSSVWWAPWGAVYYNPMDGTNGKRIRALNPWLPATQVPGTLLTIPATGPLVVNTLFQIGQLTGGYLSSTAAVVFQGYYSTGVKVGGASGSWCVAAYAIDANAENVFLLGSPELPSPIVGFDMSVTTDSTVLYNKSTVPKSGSTCARTNYLGESSLATGSAPSIVGQIQGAWPAALKQ